MISKKADAHHPDQLLLSSDQLFLPYKNHANFASKVGQKILTNSPDQLLTNFSARTYDILHKVMIPPKLQKTLETCVFPAFYRVLYNLTVYFICFANYPSCAATSAAKSSSFFSSPSPVSKRINVLILILTPSSFAVACTYCPTDCLPSSALTNT